MEAQERTQERRSNLGYTDYTALQLRLDTQKLHKDIYNFLKGTSTIIKRTETGDFIEEEIQLGKAQANDEGIQHLLSFVISLVNSQTVQGNTEKKDLMETIYFINLHLAQQLTMNCEEWGIKKRNRRHILNTLVEMIKMFLTRTIDDKERGYLTPKMESKSETIVHDRKRGII